MTRCILFPNEIKKVIIYSFIELLTKFGVWSLQVNITWMPDAGYVHDYKVGLASTANSPAPDIVAFTSTKQHPHIRIHYPDVPEGTEFHIIIKSISRSNVEGIQVISQSKYKIWTASDVNNNRYVS